MSVGKIIAGKREVISCEPRTAVREVVALLMQHRIGAVLVLDSDSILGIVSERDIVAGLNLHGPQVLDSAAAAIMTSGVVTASPADSVVGVLAVMTNRRIRHVPVVENGELCGLVSIGDLVKRRIDDAEREAAELKTYIAAA